MGVRHKTDMDHRGQKENVRKRVSFLRGKGVLRKIPIKKQEKHRGEAQRGRASHLRQNAQVRGYGIQLKATPSSRLKYQKENMLTQKRRMRKKEKFQWAEDTRQAVEGVKKVKMMFTRTRDEHTVEICIPKGAPGKKDSEQEDDSKQQISARSRKESE